MRVPARPSRRTQTAVIFAAGAVVALRAAARRPQTRGVLGTQRAPVTATAEDGGTRGRPDGSAEQMQHVFHELHAEGRHALCEVCGNQYRH